MVRSLPAAIYTCDREGRITFYNDAAAELWGRRPRLGEDFWCGSWRIYCPDGTPLPHEQCLMAQAVRHGQGARAEEIIIERPDGTRNSILAYPDPIRDSAGHVIGAVNMLIDITEHKQTDALLAGQKNILEMLATGAPLEEVLNALIHLIEINSDGLVGSILIRHPTENRFEIALAPSLSHQYIQALSQTPIVPPHSGPCGQAAYQGQAVLVADVAHDGRWASAWRNLMAQEKLRTCYSAPIFAADGRPIGSFGMYYRAQRDPKPASTHLLEIATHLASIAIERRRTETSLHKREAHLRAVVESTPECVKIIDADGTLLYINPAGLAMVEADSPSDVLGKPASDLITPEHRPAFQRLHEKVCRGEKQTLEFEIAGLKGMRRHMETHAVPLRGPDGKIQHLGLTHDVTARWRAEQASRQAQQAAEAASHAKDRFLAVLSHELRTPLSPAMLTVAAMEKDPGLPPHLREDLAMVRRNIELETKLIDDLLDLSRITTGKLQLRKQTISLHEVVRHAIRNCAAEATDKAIRIDLDLQADPDLTLADPGRLQQVVWNLVRNAIKFTPSGGFVSIASQITPDHQLQLLVRDTGVGIAPDALERIFDAFEQADARTSRQFGGLGLGLAICRMIVQLHGGSITAQSDGHDKGATFIVQLPIRTKPSTDTGQHPPHGSTHPPEHPLRILLVEDHADTAAVLSRLLRRSGHTITIAGNVSDALALAGQHPFDLLLSDLGLPDATGYELMQQIARRHGIKGIAMSGYGMEEDVRKSRQAGFSEHLVKPISLPQLQGAIRRIAGEHG